MYAKFINENTIEEAPEVKDGVYFCYNNDEYNRDRLIADGYLPVVISDEVISAPKVEKKYRLETDRIIAYWAEVPIPFNELKEQKLQEITRAFQAEKENGQAEYNGMSFSINATAQQNLTSMMLFGQTFGTDIKYLEKDGTPHNFTLSEFKPVAAAISQAIQDLSFKYYGLEAAVNAAQTPEELEAVQW